MAQPSILVTAFPDQNKLFTAGCERALLPLKVFHQAANISPTALVAIILKMDQWWRVSYWAISAA
jgi:hypothetical protein